MLLQFGLFLDYHQYQLHMTESSNPQACSRTCKQFFWPSTGLALHLR